MDCLAADTDINVVFLDGLYESDDREMEPPKNEIPHSQYEATDYVKIEKFSPVPQSTIGRMAYRGLVDSFSDVIYGTAELLRETNPDVLVSGVDQPPFLRHFIHRAHSEGILTVTVQHGTYERALDPSLIEQRLLFPNFSDKLPLFEKLKRRVGFRYGVTEYCNPYSDLVLTFGDFFSERIRSLRSEYPCSGDSDIITTGSPEYDASVVPYKPRGESLLFLSQHKFEGGNWTWTTQMEIVDLLEEIDEHMPVTVRPHPKESASKVKDVYGSFHISRNNTLSEDIENHDIITTVNSTAVFEGVIQGKPCGVLQVPNYPIEQAPFTDDHLIQIRPDVSDLTEAAKQRSEATQEAYLRRFCYMPQSGDVSYDSSEELICATIRERVTKAVSEAPHDGVGIRKPPVRHDADR